MKTTDFTRFTVYPTLFELQAILRQVSEPNDPQMTLNTKSSEVPHMHVTITPRVPNFTPFRELVRFMLMYGLVKVR